MRPSATSLYDCEPTQVANTVEFLSPAAHVLCRIGKVFSWLGLSVAAVTTEDRQGGGTGGRREKFGADITYVTGQELAFTYLFDNSDTCRSPKEQVSCFIC